MGEFTSTATWSLNNSIHYYPNSFSGFNMYSGAGIMEKSIEM